MSDAARIKAYISKRQRTIDLLNRIDTSPTRSAIRELLQIDIDEANAALHVLEVKA